MCRGRLLERAVLLLGGDMSGIDRGSFDTSDAHPGHFGMGPLCHAPLVPHTHTKTEQK